MTNDEFTTLLVSLLLAQASDASTYFMILHLAATL